MRTIEVTRFAAPRSWRCASAPIRWPAPARSWSTWSAIPLLWLDTALRSGKGRDWFPVEPPYVPGSGVAGIVSSIGPGVDSDWIGRDVVTDTEAGSYAERVAVPADGLVAIPDELTALTAAALLTDGRTALGILDGVSVKAGTPVLITGAAGGMGLLLVQLMTARGARVVGAARGEPKLAAVRVQGADAAVDFSEPGCTEGAGSSGGDRRRLCSTELAGRSAGRRFAITAEGGVFSGHGAAAGDFMRLDQDAARQHGITVRGISDVQFSPEERDRRLRDVLELAAAGRVAPVIRRPPARGLAEAHGRIEARDVVGKSLLLP